MDDLKIDRTQVLWVTSIYSLILAAFLIAFGTLSDRVGRPRLFRLGKVPSCWDVSWLEPGTAAPYSSSRRAVVAFRQHIRSGDYRPGTQSQGGHRGDDAKTAYTNAARVMTLVAAGCIIVGLGFSFGLPADRRRGEDDD